MKVIAMTEDPCDSYLIWNPSYILGDNANLDDSTGELILDIDLTFLVRPILVPNVGCRDAALIFTDQPSAEDYLARATPQELAGTPKLVEFSSDRLLARFLHWIRWNHFLEYVCLDILPPSRVGRPLLIHEILHSYLSCTDTQAPK